MKGEHSFYFGAVITILAMAHVCQSSSYRRDYPWQKLESDTVAVEAEDDNTPNFYDADYEEFGKGPLYRRQSEDAELQSGEKSQRSKRQCLHTSNCGRGMVCEIGRCIHRCRNRRRLDDNFLREENGKDYHGNWRTNLGSRQKRGQRCASDSNCASNRCSCTNFCVG